MAKFTDVNNGHNAAYHYCDALLAFKTLLKSAGWTVPSSSDGLTYNSSGDQISHGATGAGGMGNPSAWFRLQDPAGLREFCIQRSASVTVDPSWRVKYSAADKFVGGSPGILQTPSATDEAILLGGGDDATPTFADWFNSATMTVAFYHCVAFSDAINGVYAFYAWSTYQGIGDQYHSFACEPLASASYPSADTDPCVVVAARFFSGWKGWYRKDSAVEQFVDWGDGQYMRGSSYPIYPAAAGVNPYDTDENAVPMLLGRTWYSSSGPMIGPKGFTGRLLLKGSTKVYPHTTNLATDARVFVVNFLVPWENGTAPLLS